MPYTVSHEGGKMASWYVKEFSKLTNITVRTLHHYDRIDLLKPSKRLDNGYRVYSEYDLLKVQPIVVLRFFGFSLSTIKEIIATGIITPASLFSQEKAIKGEMAHLESAHTILEKLIAELKDLKSIDLYKMLQLIEKHSVDDLKKKWFVKTFRQDKLKDFLGRYSDNRWDDLILEVEKNLDEDPRGPQGKLLAQSWQLLSQKERQTKALKREVVQWIESAIRELE